ncbi:DUF4956 domain-containing protein [Christensenellaceae bacterium NSJ-63]|uniref:DUF4956 domain-containing protein n=1 Tax=Guopingia tenuis TaxID=2763656 RepID=A0A926HSL8_9FIRM|nr:DUF4956 domain-containing protein [Guopingia tenuis]MBC8538592.1 DUF4956 domain-containing protein [Guopingia tenuis]
MGASSVVKKSVLDGFVNSGDISWDYALLTIAVAFLLGLFIFFIYKRTFSGVVFTKSFGISLILLSMITAAVIMTISSNLMLSLGMVGALSIVRFRTAVKDPMDTIYMFWAIAAGIMVGANLLLVAVISCVVIGIFMVVLSIFKVRKNMPYILVIRFEEGAKGDVQSMLRKLPQGRLKSKTVSRGVIELTLELNVTDAEIALIDRFADIPGVYDASLISYTGDVIA